MAGLSHVQADPRGPSFRYVLQLHFYSQPLYESGGRPLGVVRIPQVRLHAAVPGCAATV